MKCGDKQVMSHLHYVTTFAHPAQEAPQNNFDLFNLLFDQFPAPTDLPSCSAGDSGFRQCSSLISCPEKTGSSRSNRSVRLFHR